MLQQVQVRATRYETINSISLRGRNNINNFPKQQEEKKQQDDPQS